MMALSALLALLLGLCGRAASTNPIVDGVGMADPHMHVWPADPSRVFLYSTHDCSPHGRPPCVAAPEAEGQAGAPGFRMDDWWVWSSTVSAPSSSPPPPAGQPRQRLSLLGPSPRIW